jgi:hypothetical protein
MVGSRLSFQQQSRSSHLRVRAYAAEQLAAVRPLRWYGNERCPDRRTLPTDNSDLRRSTPRLASLYIPTDSENLTTTVRPGLQRQRQNYMPAGAAIAFCLTFGQLSHYTLHDSKTHAGQDRRCAAASAAVRSACLCWRSSMCSLV